MDKENQNQWSSPTRTNRAVLGESNFAHPGIPQFKQKAVHRSNSVSELVSLFQDGVNQKANKTSKNPVAGQVHQASQNRVPKGSMNQSVKSPSKVQPQSTPRAPPQTRTLNTAPVQPESPLQVVSANGSPFTDRAPQTPKSSQTQDYKKLHRDLLDKYSEKHTLLLSHQRMMEQLKFEMLEIESELEECKRNQHFSNQHGSQANDVYRKIHVETTRELANLTEVSPFGTESLVKKAEAYQDDFMPKINQLTNRASNIFLNNTMTAANDLRTLTDKTSRFFHEVVHTLSPKKGSPLKRTDDILNSSFTFENLSSETIWYDESEVVDIDEYESESE